MRNFKLQEDVFSSYAYFSEDGKNRFYLRRFWDEMKLIGAPKYAMFLGVVTLNYFEILSTNRA
jgi:hypothetical protein